MTMLGLELLQVRSLEVKGMFRSFSILQHLVNQSKWNG